MKNQRFIFPCKEYHLGNETLNEPDLLRYTRIINQLNLLLLYYKTKCPDKDFRNDYSGLHA